MPGCNCESGATTLAADAGRRRTLLIVLGINAVMFVVVLLAGLWADSKALVADSGDNLGDALTYALSLLVIGHSMRWRAGAAVVKGAIQLVFGILILVGIIASLLGEPDPIGPAIMAMAAISLVANLACFALLLKHRNDDLNMRSVWLCSRNDVLANAGVIVAGVLVTWLGAFWPDLVVAALIAGVFLHTSCVVLRDAVAAWNGAGEHRGVGDPDAVLPERQRSGVG